MKSENRAACCAAVLGFALGALLLFLAPGIAHAQGYPASSGYPALPGNYNSGNPAIPPGYTPQGYGSPMAAPDYVKPWNAIPPARAYTYSDWASQPGQARTMSNGAALNETTGSGSVPPPPDLTAGASTMVTYFFSLLNQFSPFIFAIMGVITAGLVVGKLRDVLGR